MKNLIEIITQAGSISGAVLILWILLKYMKGLPWIVMQWLIVAFAAAAGAIALAMFAAYAWHFIFTS